ncbi:hypothetical protein [Arenibacter algicola]|uniref:Uncharacterized protein n=1 Tax=Arenibacter algicola TaxID=616991 RepID=A0A221UW36_9FLAO|nr:hypothetical protein [Arenibacter algicola]ASO05388.1 hypothetical protein AREALGSMS7_01926 [Arenibacter algicola]
MGVRNFILITLLTLFFIRSQGQTLQDSTSTTLQTEKQFEIQQVVQQVEVPNYQLFPTTNTWALIKLNTRNGKIWQVHFSISNDFEGELSLNPYSLVLPDEEINGRFTLYPTPNMYNFILLDQIDGTTWKVQWNNERDKRFIRRLD